jgi:hypothetical protein
MLNVGVTTLTAWNNGSSFPRPRQIDKLVDRLRPGDARARRALRYEIEAALAADSGDSGINVEPLDYWPFSGTRRRVVGSGDDEGFLETILKHSLGPHQGREVMFGKPRTGADDAEQRVYRRSNQVNVCMFDTLGRSAELHTFHSPIQMTINAVVLSEGRDGAERARTDLEGLLLSEHRRFHQFVPVALRPEIGFRYLRDNLRFRGLEEAIDREGLRLDPASFAETLIRAHEQRCRRDSVAFAIVDELTALRVLSELAERKLNHGLRWHAGLVFPLSTQASTRLDAKRRLPVFTAGLATAWVGADTLVDLLRRGLMATLAQTEFVATHYYQLYQRLRDEIQECLNRVERADADCHRRLQDLQREPVGIESLWNEGCAIQVAQHTLRLSAGEPLDVLDTLNLPWRHVVGRVRAMLPSPREGTESVRESRFRLAFLPLEPVVCTPKTDSGKQKLTFNLARRTLDLSVLGFAGRFLRPVQHLADPVQIGSSEQEARVTAFSDRAEDVRIGRMETYDRGRFWKFYRVPFFVPLNAVVLASELKRLDLDVHALRRAVSPYTPFTNEHDLKEAQRIRGMLRFVVLDAGAGSELFLQEEDGFSPAKRIVIRNRSVPDYAEALKPEEGASIRVLVVQTFNCLRVQLYKHGEAVLLFDVGNVAEPMSGPLAPLTKTIPHLWMPEYNVPISVNRDSRMWIEFFDYAFPKHLREDCRELVELVDLLRTDTIGELQSLLDERDHARACDIAQHFLCLDSFGVDRLPEWEPILRVVRTRHSPTAQWVPSRAESRNFGRGEQIYGELESSGF